MSLRRAHRSVFPLTLVPFESMMCVDDRALYPMTCGAEFTFLGCADRPALTAAIHQAAARHPLLTCHVKSAGKGRRCWVPSGESIPVTWLDQDQSDDFAGQQPIDLRTQGGMQVSVACNDQTTRLRFHFHHACCDAAGGLAFVEDILVFYASCCGDVSMSVVPRKLQPSKLKHRGQIRNRPRSVGNRVQTTAATLHQLFQLAAYPAMPLASAVSGSSGRLETWHTQSCVIHQYEEDVLRGLRYQAMRLGTTLNDLIASNLFRTLHAWQVEQNALPGNRLLRIVIPVNLRDQEDIGMPAANKMGYGFVSLRTTDVSDEERRLTAVHRITERLRRLRLPHAALRCLGIVCGIPGALSWLMSTRRCLATAVLTNIGDPTRRFAVTFPRDRGRLVAGNLILDRISSVAPLRPLTRAVFSVNTYANRLTLTARCDPAYFFPEHAAWLLRGLVSPPATTTLSQPGVEPRERSERAPPWDGSPEHQTAPTGRP